MNFLTGFFREAKPHSYALFDRVQKQHRISSTFPLVQLLDDERTVQAKNEALVQVLELQGVDYTGMNQAQIKKLFNIRKQLFQSGYGRVNIAIHSSKRKIQRPQHEDGTDIDEQHIEQVLTQTWEKQFHEIYRTTHHVVITANPPSKASKAATFIEESLNKSVESLLSESVMTLIEKLRPFGARLLEGEELSSFFATLLNGRPSKVRAKHWDNTLCNQILTFDRKWSHCQYGRFHETKVASFLSIQAYPDELTEKVLNDVYTLNADVNIYQSFTPLALDDSKGRIKAEYKRAHTDGDTASTKGISDLEDEINSENITLCQHYFGVEIIADSSEELEHQTGRIKTAIERHGLLCFRETVNIEPLYWSRFPTLEWLNVRARTISNENAADLVTFSKVGEGFETNGFGHRPITHFRTNMNSLFSFNLHQSPDTDKNINGHTLVIGGTGSGKTVLSSFIIANCLEYNNFQAILFDRLQGLQAFTEIFDGDYLDFSETLEMNPLKVQDSMENRRFLSQWLQSLMHIKSEDTSAVNGIENIVRQIFTIPEHERSLDAVSLLFGREGDALHTKVRKWLSGGSFGSYFNGKRDSFSFDKKIVTFDATSILNFPDLLGAVTDYLFHRHMQHVSQKSVPHILFFDEAPRYFQDPIFAKRIIESIKEIRKKRGIVMLASQDVATIKGLKGDTGAEILASMANYLIYPNSSATKEHYVDYLGLNETELKWIQDTDESSRQVLFKRTKSGESVVLNVDLSPLNNQRHTLMNAFDSGTNKVLELKELKAQYPENWKYHYLKTPKTNTKEIEIPNERTRC